MNYRKGLPYVGSKYYLLQELFPLFPKNINHFIEPFTGGNNVALNLKAEYYSLNDSMSILIELYKAMKKYKTASILFSIEEKIKKYSLSKTNSVGYIELRNNFNKHPKRFHSQDLIEFFLLICHSFSNQIRFNNAGGFNLPFGERTFNSSIKSNLINMLNWFHTNNKRIELYNEDYSSFILNAIIKHENNFVYLDPPYYNTGANYNKSWKLQDEENLFRTLEYLMNNNILFGMSNVFIDDKPTSIYMEEFLKLPNVYMHYLNEGYDSCFYNKKKKNMKEIYITNLKV